jgi:hypothetical protein
MTPLYPAPARVPDDLRLLASGTPQAQIQKLAEVSNLMHLVDTPLSAGYVLGMVRGRLNTLRDLGLLSGSECATISATIKGQFDERWPGLFKEVMGRGG